MPLVVKHKCYELGLDLYSELGCGKYLSHSYTEMEKLPMTEKLDNIFKHRPPQVNLGHLFGIYVNVNKLTCQPLYVCLKTVWVNMG